MAGLVEFKVFPLAYRCPLLQNTELGNKKVKQSHYRTEVAQRVPRS
jgi:hypothetical protein